MILKGAYRALVIHYPTLLPLEPPFRSFPSPNLRLHSSIHSYIFQALRLIPTSRRKLVDVVKASSFGTDEKRLFLADLVTHSHPAPQLPGVKKGPFGRTKAAPLPAQSQ